MGQDQIVKDYSSEGGGAKVKDAVWEVVFVKALAVFADAQIAGTQNPIR